MPCSRTFRKSVPDFAGEFSGKVPGADSVRDFPFVQYLAVRCAVWPFGTRPVLSRHSVAAVFLKFAHSESCCNNDPVAEHQQCGKDEDYAYNADNRAPGHEHAHGAYDVDIRINCNAESCGEQSRAGYDYRRTEAESAADTASRLPQPFSRSAL